MENIVCIDKIIEKLLSVKVGKLVDLKEEEIKYLIEKSISIIKNQKMLVELEAPFRVFGNINGQYYDLIRFFENFGYPPDINCLFLGGYVNKGRQGLETICLLLSYKIKYPGKIILLRGSDESSISTRTYGFYDECKRRYNIRIWKQFTELFNYLPVAAIINKKILCVHSGLSPELRNLNDINNIVRPTEIPDIGLLHDLLYNNPDKDCIEYDEGDENELIFGEKVVEDFNKENDLDLIIRSHELVNDGYEYFAQRKLLTIFSAPNYCGKYDNCGSVINIDENLTVSLSVLRPVNALSKSK